MSCDVFPAKKLIKNTACEQLEQNGFSTFTPSHIIIANMFEFKDKEDFDSFNAEGFVVSVHG